MKKIALISLVFCFFYAQQNFATNPYWGKTGHRVIGEIAAAHLSKKARKNIDKLLKGQGLALVSIYADEIKSDDRYDKYGPWHYVNIPFDKTYDTHPKNPKGDLIQGINTCVEILNDENSSNDDKVFHLKMLVHLIGDLHQPLHTGLSENRGGNDIKLQWFWDDSNLHRVWDTDMIESYKMSYTELANNREELSKRQLAFYQEGELMDWVNESRAYAKDIYNSTKAGDNISYQYMYNWFPLVRTQLQKGGVRLAKVLNELFD
ncbi:S1/P1 nuclease [Gangjinia marincola]|uniref:S1/P1 nuclease n=1 Tax=Gangjinia marincola TaxID=578463 RepID=A0ABP3XRL0_9FLAO